MQTKHLVLDKLAQCEGVAVSGQELAQLLCISRMSVSKAVKALIKSGYKISAQTNKGYTLQKGSDVFSQMAIKKHYSYEVFFEDSTQSTNSKARQLAENGAPHGTLCAAALQTGGRGRRNKSFFSPAGSGVYFSVILKNLSLENAGLITAAAAVATLRAIKQLYNITLSIKWVNDLYYNGKKVCGILTEAAAGFESGEAEYAVVGIGINLLEPVGGFPPEINDIAGAIFSENAQISRSKLCAAIATELIDICEHKCDIISEYRIASCVLGKQIYVTRGTEKRLATALSINERGHLAVRYHDNGVVDTLYFGEVSIKST